MILARGRGALEAYKNALTEGETSVKRLNIMLIGPHQSGKTSLKKSLKGEHFNKHEERTEWIDLDSSHFEVLADTWKTGVNAKETSSDAAISYEQVQESMVSPHVSTASKHKYKSSDTLEDLQWSEKSTYLNQANRQRELAGRRNACGAPKGDKYDQTYTPLIMPNIPEDITTSTEEALEDKEDIYSVLWDFGGQSVYYATQPIFPTQRALYLLVCDLSQNPHDTPKLDVKKGMFEKFENRYGLETNLDFINFWMTSVASLACEDESNQGLPKSELLPEKLPPVLLVCTHADKPCGGGDPLKTAQNFFGSLQTNSYRSHFYRDIFVVDNTRSGYETECPEVVRLRQELLAVAKELPHTKETIPIKWLRFEKAVQAMAKEGNKLISLEKAKQIASEVCKISEDKQFQTLLDFLHDQGVLIHFDDTPELNKLVILDPQWLIDVVKKVPTVKPYCHQGTGLHKQWYKLETTGIVEEKLLEHVWSPLLDQEETSESLIAIMERLGLLYPWPSSNASCSKQYLVPSMLLSPPPEGIVEVINSAEIPSLFLTFENDFVPPGLFTRLVLQFSQWVKDKYESPVDPQLHHNFARFYISEEKNCSVILLCRSLSIEVLVHNKWNSDRYSIDSLEVTDSLSVDVSYDTVRCARAVGRKLGLILESMRKEFLWLKNMKYELSVACPVCCQGGKVNYCHTHDTQDCKQEECLHFRPLSELYNATQVISFNRFARHDFRVDVDQFAPWFVTPGEKVNKFSSNV